MALGLALPKGSAAAAIVLGNIHSIVFCSMDPSWLPAGHACVQQLSHWHLLDRRKVPHEAPRCLTALHNLQRLNIELVTQNGTTGANPELLPGYPRFASLAALSGLTNLQLTAKLDGSKEPLRRGERQRAVLDVVSQLTALRELDFSAGLDGRAGAITGTIEAGVAMLSALTNLESLRLQYVGLQQLSAGRPAADLSPDQANITSAGRQQAVPTRADSSNLRQQVYEVGCSIRSFASLQPLLSEVQLQRLALRISLEGHWGARICQKLMFRADRLRVLSLSRCSGLLPN